MRKLFSLLLCLTLFVISANAFESGGKQNVPQGITTFTQQVVTPQVATTNYIFTASAGVINLYNSGGAVLCRTVNPDILMVTQKVSEANKQVVLNIDTSQPFLATQYIIKTNFRLNVADIFTLKRPIQITVVANNKINPAKENFPLKNCLRFYC